MKASGLNEGDIINHVNGVYFSSAAEVCSESFVKPGCGEIQPNITLYRG